MKKAILFSMGLGALLCLAGPLFAESDLEVRANVPFPFVAGKETLPAGEYDFVLDYENAPEVLGIRSKDGKSRDVLLSEAEGESRPARKSDLVFELIGNTHYLSQVEVSGRDRKEIVPQTEILREYARNAAHDNGNHRATVTVPLRKG
jgi:hypothetical protein